MKHLQSLYKIALQGLSWLQWLPPFLARLILADVFIESGWGKIHNIEKVIGFFTELGIPQPELQAHFVSYTELICGSALLIGLLARLASVPLAVTMVVAILTAKKDDLNSLSDLTGFTEFLYIALLLWVAISGPGAVSIDRFIVKRILNPDPK